MYNMLEPSELVDGEKKIREKFSGLRDLEEKLFWVRVRTWKISSSKWLNEKKLGKIYDEIHIRKKLVLARNNFYHILTGGHIIVRIILGWIYSHKISLVLFCFFFLRARRQKWRRPNFRKEFFPYALAKYFVNTKTEKVLTETGW